MMKSFEEILLLVNTEIDHINWRRSPLGLYEPIGYVLSLGGKRIRPAITLMACNIFSEDVMQAMKAAISLEIFHNFTLLHDDIMDVPICDAGNQLYIKNGVDITAILSGDVMQIEAYRWMTESPEDKLKIFFCFQKLLLKFVKVNSLIWNLRDVMK